MNDWPDQSRGEVDRLRVDIDSMRDKVREHDRLKESNRDLCLVLAETRAEVIRLVERLMYAEKMRDSALRANDALRNDVTLLTAQKRASAFRKQASEAESQIEEIRLLCLDTLVGWHRPGLTLQDVASCILTIIGKGEHAVSDQ